MRSAELQWSRRRHAFGELQVFQVRNEHRWQGFLNPFFPVYISISHSESYDPHRLALPLLLLPWLRWLIAAGGTAQLHSSMAASVHIANCNRERGRGEGGGQAGELSGPGDREREERTHQARFKDVVREIHKFRCGTGQQLHALELRVVELGHISLNTVSAAYNGAHARGERSPREQQHRSAASSLREEKRRAWSSGKVSGAASSTARTCRSDYNNTCNNDHRQSMRTCGLAAQAAG